MINSKAHVKSHVTYVPSHLTSCHLFSSPCWVSSQYGQVQVAYSLSLHQVWSPYQASITYSSVFIESQITYFEVHALSCYFNSQSMPGLRQVKTCLWPLILEFKSSFLLSQHKMFLTSGHWFSCPHSLVINLQSEYSLKVVIPTLFLSPHWKLKFLFSSSH